MSMVSNANGKIWEALQSRLDDWADCPVYLPMSVNNPGADDDFIVVQNVSLEYSGPIPLTVECGTPFTGFLNLGVCVPTDWKYGSLVGRAGKLADFFMFGSRYDYQDISVEIMRRGRVDGNVQLQEPWNRLNVRIDWRAWG